MTENKIIYRKIFGYTVLHYKSDSYGHSTTIDPIISSFSSISVDIGKKDSRYNMVGILPAHDDYAVYGEMPNNTLTLLGYEHGGKSYNPNWEDILNKEIALWEKNNTI